MDDAYRFAPAAPEEEYVYGAACPGWHTAADHEAAVAAWISFMRDQGVERVCCLVPGGDPAGCQFNLDRYAAAFGDENVLHAPLVDRRFYDPRVVEETIMPFLEASVRRGERVVVHGLSGLGRTGQVLAAWLVRRHGYEPEGALKTVKQMGRAPDEDIGDTRDTEELVEHLSRAH